MEKPENKETIRNFCNYLLNLGLENRMNLFELLKPDLRTYILLFGRRLNILKECYDEIIGFKFNKKDYVTLSDGRKIKGICYVTACSTLGFIFDNGIGWPINIMTEDNWSQIIRNIWKEDEHI